MAKLIRERTEIATTKEKNSVQVKIILEYRTEGDIADFVYTDDTIKTEKIFAKILPQIADIEVIHLDND